MIPPIKDADINWAEQVLGQSISFDPAARAFIRSLGPVEVVACPGSGKTTALIAKLLILSRHLPLLGNRGICVLTHTNVAVDEITRRLSSISSGILSYPSFCGTFQSFVGRLLGYPGYVEEFGHRPLHVDDATASRELQCRRSEALRRARFYLEQRALTLEALRFNKNLLVVKKGEDIPFVSEDAPTYSTVHGVKMDVLKSGYMFYDDSYVLAQRYLERHPELPELFRQRFPFAFIDEMQDTDQPQLDLVRMLFRDGTSLQLVGDPNQAIYLRDAVGTECTWKPSADALSLPTSLRFDRPIADVVTRLASVAPMNVEGNGKGIEFKPHLFLFSDARISEVIPRFAQLIRQLGLPQLPVRQVYKAVGWVAKEKPDGKHTVPSYWSGFRAATERKRTQYATLKGNLSGAVTSASPDFPRRFRSAILASIARFARSAKVVSPSGRHFTESTVREHLEVTAATALRELEIRIAEWCLEARSGRDVSEGVGAFLLGTLAPHLGVDVSAQAVKAFLDDNDFEPSGGQAVLSNVIPFDGVNIEVSSVHGVKSETHTATLYLDTFYNGYDVHRILPFLKGAMPNGNEPALVKESMKVAFVACSRPSHLLCVAIHADTAGRGKTRSFVAEEDVDDLAHAWEIIDLR